MPDAGPYLLGLDAGNTVIKAVLFDMSGRQLARAARDGRSSSPKPNHVERDLDELWTNAGHVIRDCINTAGIQADEIAGVGCAGHGNGLYLIDGDGNALLGIQSLDTRAATLTEELARANGNQLHDACLQKPWPSQTPTLLAWVKRHEPDLYERASAVLLCKDAVNFWLTGEAASDISDMSGAGLLSMPTADYDDDLLQLYGLANARAKLPRLLQPTDVVGHVNARAARATGLAEGTPVVGGLFDVVASALGSGVVQPGEASIIAGTWSINQVLSSEAVRDPGVFMVSCFRPDRFFSIEASATSAANLEWYVRTFVERDGHHSAPFDHCNARVAEITPRADDPIFHPYLYGSGISAAARGGFFGLAGWHGEGHLLRALYEGVVFEHRRHIETLLASGIPFEAATMSGGGTRSPHWPQMMADCLGMAISVPESHETGALGAAIAAGVGTGIFSNLEHGVQSMARTQRVFQPQPELKAHYDQRYKQFMDLAASLDSFWTSQARQADEVRT